MTSSVGSAIMIEWLEVVGFVMRNFGTSLTSMSLIQHYMGHSRQCSTSGTYMAWLIIKIKWSPVSTRVPLLQTVQAVSSYSILHVLWSHMNNLSSSLGSVNRFGGGWYDGSMTSICPPGWNLEIEPHAAMSQVGRKCPSGRVQTQQCSSPSRSAWHSYPCKMT